MTLFQLALVAVGLVAMVGSVRVGAIIVAGVLAASFFLEWPDPAKSLAIAGVWTVAALACLAVGSHVGACALAMVSVVSLAAATHGGLVTWADVCAEGIIYALAAWSAWHGPGPGIGKALGLRPEWWRASFWRRSGYHVARVAKSAAGNPLRGEKDAT